MNDLIDLAEIEPCACDDSSDYGPQECLKCKVLRNESLIAAVPQMIGTLKSLRDISHLLPDHVLARIIQVISLAEGKP